MIPAWNLATAVQTSAPGAPAPKGVEEEATPRVPVLVVAMAEVAGATKGASTSVTVAATFALFVATSRDAAAASRKTRVPEIAAATAEIAGATTPASTITIAAQTSAISVISTTAEEEATSALAIAVPAHVAKPTTPAGGAATIFAIAMTPAVGTMLTVAGDLSPVVATAVRPTGLPDAIT